MINDVLYFPSVRVAFEKTTRTIDQLMAEASKNNNEEASKAYRQCFGLIRQAIKQIEHQGESSLHRQLDSDIEDLKQIAQDCCTKIKECIKEQATLAFEGTKAAIIDILNNKGFDDKYIEEVMEEIDKIAEEEVESIFSEEGIGFSEESV